MRGNRLHPLKKLKKLYFLGGKCAKFEIRYAELSKISAESWPITFLYLSSMEGKIEGLLRADRSYSLFEYSYYLLVHVPCPLRRLAINMSILTLFAAALNKWADDNPNHCRKLRSQKRLLLPGPFLLAILRCAISWSSLYLICFMKWFRL